MEEKFKVIAEHLELLLAANQECFNAAGNGELRRTLDSECSSEEELEVNRSVVIDAINDYQQEITTCKTLLEALKKNDVAPLLIYFQKELKSIRKGRKEFLKIFPFANLHFDTATMSRGAERHAAQVAQYENFIAILST